MPEIEFRPSYIYAKQLSDHGRPDWIRIKSLSEELEREFRKREQRILERISQLTGNRWKKSQIIVYPVLTKLKSFSDPLTISLKEDSWLNLVILIHELVHNILDKPITPRELQEYAINQVVKNIVDEQIPEARKAFDRFETFFTQTKEYQNIKATDAFNHKL